MTKNENNKPIVKPPKILVYGYGNPGRQDDSLGVRLTDFVGRWAEDNKFTNIETDQNYQLNIEDAERISGFDIVVFCDASVKDIEDAELEAVVPDLKTEFTMHAVTPSFVVGLCSRIFNYEPEAYQLHIRGYSWEFMQEITEHASANLNQGQILITNFLLKKMVTAR